MFLSKIFKFTREKALIGLVGVTLVFSSLTSIFCVSASSAYGITETRATSTTRIYFEDDSNWSNNSWNSTKIWAWGTGGNIANDFNNRPSMTQVGSHNYGGNNYYYFDLDTDSYQTFFITRNGDDARTATVTVPGDGKRFLTLDSFQWRSGDDSRTCAVSWHNDYTDYYVVGDHSSWAVNSNAYRLLRNYENIADLGYAIGVGFTKDGKFKIVTSADGTNIDTWHNINGLASGCAYGALTWTGATNDIVSNITCVFDFYYTYGNNIYVRGGNSSTLGYVYIGTNFASNAGVAVTNVYSYIADGQLTSDAWPGSSLASFFATQSSARLYFQNRGHVYRIPVTAFAGAKYVIFNNGGNGTQTAHFPISSGMYYELTNDPTTSAAGSGNANYGFAAAVAFDIDSAMTSAPNNSICNVEKSTATTLCIAYDALTGAAKTTIENSATNYVKTYSSTKPTYTGSANVGFASLRKQLGNIAGGTYIVSLGVIPGPNGNESPLTLTLWIVLGAGILGMGAIGTAYFVSKKKKKRHKA